MALQKVGHARNIFGAGLKIAGSPHVSLLGTGLLRERSGTSSPWDWPRPCPLFQGQGLAHRKLRTKACPGLGQSARKAGVRLEVNQ